MARGPRFGKPWFNIRFLKNLEVLASSIDQLNDTVLLYIKFKLLSLGFGMLHSSEITKRNKTEQTQFKFAYHT